MLLYFFQIDWAAPIRKSWDFSEQGAWDALALFLEEGISFTSCCSIMYLIDTHGHAGLK